MTNDELLLFLEACIDHCILRVTECAISKSYHEGARDALKDLRNAIRSKEEHVILKSERSENEEHC